MADYEAILNDATAHFRELLAQLTQRTAEGPCFSFSVSYQNHGPYESAYSAGVEYFTPANSGMAAESCHIWNNYLRGVDSTIQAMVQLTQGLEELDRPVVLVLFGVSLFLSLRGRGKK